MSSQHEVWVAGFPSFYGGADTELLHAIELWRSRGLGVHLVPMFGANPHIRERMVGLGCRIHRYEPSLFTDRTVVSYCNEGFLSALPQIISAGRPRKIIWLNCMTWLLPNEATAHATNSIDFFGFCSEYQRRLLLPQLEAIAPVKVFDYRPYFNLERVRWHLRDRRHSYHIGRISRDDAAKFAPDTWQIFDRVLVPPGVAKRVFILGYGPNAFRRIGPPPDTLDWLTWAPGAVPASTFFRSVDTMIHKTGGSREAYPRVVLEAYAYGVVPVVERDYGLPEMVVHGETGFLAESSDEMSYWATWLAAHPHEQSRLAAQGRRHLEETCADSETAWAGWEAVLLG